MDPVVLGSKFVNVSPSSTAQLVAPSANVNGLIIRTASIDLGSTYGFLSTGTKAPTGYTDLTVPVVLLARGTEAGSGFPGASATLPYELQIPAGYGLWFTKGSSGNGVGSAHITYDLVA